LVQHAIDVAAACLSAPGAALEEAEECEGDVSLREKDVWGGVSESMAEHSRY
jgi:hypothetical protein